MKRNRNLTTTVTYDFQGMLAHLTHTRARCWKPQNGPETRSGIDYYYRHSSGREAYLNLDQIHLTVSVDAETLFSGDPARDAELNRFVVEK